MARGLAAYVAKKGDTARREPHATILRLGVPVRPERPQSAAGRGILRAARVNGTESLLGSTRIPFLQYEETGAISRSTHEEVRIAAIGRELGPITRDQDCAPTMRGSAVSASPWQDWS